jgi:hypothetical protein
MKCQWSTLFSTYSGFWLFCLVLCFVVASTLCSLDYASNCCMLHVHWDLQWRNLHISTGIVLKTCRKRASAPETRSTAASTNTLSTNAQQQVDAIKGMTPEERREYVTNFLKTQVCRKSHKLRWWGIIIQLQLTWSMPTKLSWATEICG